MRTLEAARWPGRQLTIALCGDIMLGAEVAQCMGDATVAEWLAGVSPTWQEADLVIANLESPCVVEAKPVPIRGRTPELVFHASACRLQELSAAGLSAVTLANNHVLDCGAEGLMETMRGLERAGLYHAGAGMNLAEAIQPAFIPVRDMTVGLVAFCYGQLAGPAKAGAAPCDPKTMRRALTAARAGADLVIAALHDGLEYSDVPPRRTRARFRFLAENGADIVVGHHPHTLQGLEWCNSVPIAYSLGDLLFDNSLPHVAKRNFARIAMGRYGVHEVRRDPGKFGRGAVLTVDIGGGGTSIQWHPFRQDPNLRPQLSAGETRAEDLCRLKDLSAALLSAEDPRHALAELVAKAADEASLEGLQIRDLLPFVRRPRWRYVPKGLTWLWSRATRRPAPGAGC